jgi:hypothetical protein
MNRSDFQVLLLRLKLAPRVWLYRLATLSAPRAKRLRLVAYPLSGVVAGLLALHPFSMLVCQLSGMLGGMSSGQALAHSFHHSMWLMWLFYAALGGVVGYFTALFVNHLCLVRPHPRAWRATGRSGRLETARFLPLGERRSGDARRLSRLPARCSEGAAKYRNRLKSRARRPPCRDAGPGYFRVLKYLVSAAASSGHKSTDCIGVPGMIASGLFRKI